MRSTRTIPMMAETQAVEKTSNPRRQKVMVTMAARDTPRRRPVSSHMVRYCS